ncbi:uncharacterized protein LOC122070725 isoform X2 [Macadamia integrifolia]|uniref:uncharacterized protein LOC122070725 isoform X2 n=1 Tax=Macadamia integrifolia TaxID=60698 RepID=UPI001C4EC851|nr:uncharacterized protein LOC122070725 isoform X2 [Macadamia integrifolia]
MNNGYQKDNQEAKVPLRPDIEESGVEEGVGMKGCHGLKLDLEFKPIEHPVEPPDEDRPVKCPLPGSSVPNDVQMQVDRLAESLRKRGELSSDMNEEEGMLVVAIEPPARAVRKRHHTLTRNHSIPPLFNRAPLPPLPNRNSTIFEMLQQCDEYEPNQDMQY